MGLARNAPCCGRALNGRGTCIVLAFLAVFALTYFCVAVPLDLDRAAPVWLANAALLVLILRSPPRQWPELLVAGLCGNVLANLVAPAGPELNVPPALCNTLEVVVLAVSLRATLGQPFDPARPRHLAIFISLALGASLLSAMAGAVAHWILQGRPAMLDLAVWVLADTLGLVIVTPCLLILREAPAYLKETPLTLQGAAALLLVALTAVALFGQGDVPLLFLAPAVLAGAAATMEVLGAALAVLLLTAIALALIAAGFGPAALLAMHPTKKIILMQVFLAVCTVFSLVTAAQKIQRRRLADALATARDVAVAQAARARAAEVEMAGREAQFRLLAEHATDVIVHVDPAGVFLYVSPACRRLGYEPQELIGRSRQDFVHPDDADRMERMIAAAWREADMPPPSEREYRIRSKDGQWLWMEGSPSLVKDDQGAAIGAIALMRDVTQRREMERRLAQAVAEAQAANAAKGEFLANVSHELRTPLTAILGFSSALSEDVELPATGRRYLQRITGASRALLTALNDLLEFSELEANQVRILRLPLRALAQAQATMDIFAPEAEAKGLVVRVEDAGAPDCVLADGERLRQVLFNLIGNAVKFTRQGGVTLRVDYEPAQSKLSYAVIDTGPGVLREDAERLFQRFTQLGPTRGGRGGNGLGLAICKRVVEAMDGRIGMRPHPGGGSEFWFEIPAPVSHLDPGDDVRPPAAVPLCGVRVLMAEDQAETRALVRSLLQPFQVDLTEAEDGLSACAYAAEAPYDIILMDLQMPRLDGPRAAMRIRQALGPNQDTPIVAFSAREARRMLPPEDLLFFDDYLEKPTSREALRLKLEQWSQ